LTRSSSRERILALEVDFDLVSLNPNFALARKSTFCCSDFVPNKDPGPTGFPEPYTIRVTGEQSQPMPPKSKKKTPPALSITASEPIQNGFSLISNQKLLSLYSTMLKCRMIEERLRILVQDRALPASHGAVPGRESLAGVIIDLLPADTVVAAPGNPIPSFINGAPLEELICDLFHTPAAFAGTAARLNLAAQKAMDGKLNKPNSIAVAICDDDRASLDPWREALSFARAYTLPMIFVAWKNATPLKPKAHSLPIIPVDGNDAVAVYRVASEAITHARKGNGPTLIHCVYPTATDTILNMEKYLAGKGLFSATRKAEVSAQFGKELAAAIETAKKLACPDGANAATK
jgi:TPP-dependent pyruvate/acetoin dehydrogenase alpha subunit